MTTSPDLTTELMAGWNDKKGQVFRQAIQYIRLPLTITDPTVPGNPIVFVNDAFCDLTGYARDEILGRNCKFLQGRDTTEDSKGRIREILDQQELETVEIVNYRKDGSAFLNALQIGPILDETGALMFFVGTQYDISRQREREEAASKLRARELLHRLRNIVNVMAVTIRLTSRDFPGTEALRDRITGRLRALSDGHFRILEEAEPEQPVPLERLLHGVLDAYGTGDDSPFEMSGPPVDTDAGYVGPIALVLHELATNATKYGALNTSEGRVDITWTAQDGALTIVWTERDGPPVTPPERQGGSEIIRSILASAKGKLHMDWREQGLVVTIELPDREGSA